MRYYSKSLHFRNSISYDAKIRDARAIDFISKSSLCGMLEIYSQNNKDDIPHQIDKSWGYPVTDKAKIDWKAKILPRPAFPHELNEKFVVMAC